MTDIDELCKCLKEWRSEPEKKINDVLDIVKTLSYKESPESLEKLITTLHEFKKETEKERRKGVPVNDSWFLICKEREEYLKKVCKKIKDGKFDEVTYKRIEEVVFPEELEGEIMQFQFVHRLIFTSFAVNMKEKYTVLQKERMFDFTKEIAENLIKECGKMNGSSEKMNNLFKKLDLLSNKLQSHESTVSKEEMMEGSIPASDVAKFEIFAFFEEHAKKLRKERLKRQSTEGSK